MNLRQTDTSLLVFVRRARVRFNQKAEDFDRLERLLTLEVHRPELFSILTRIWRLLTGQDAGSAEISSPVISRAKSKHSVSNINRPA